jgi:hypothetical protein
MLKPSSLVRIFGIVSSCALFFACDDPEGLVVECVDPAGSVPAGGWVCGEEKIVECTSPDGAEVDIIYTQLEAGSCDATELTVSDSGPFALGEHEISVTATPDGGDEALLCTSTLTVVDTTPPKVRSKTSELWPPNHKFHTIAIGECVEVWDACDRDVDVTFTYATSDEPRNSTGDGNTDLDIANFGCRSVDLLAERKGNGDARVYTLGYKAVDASGNATEGECHVIVPHDQGGKVPVDSGAAYREEAPACE